MLPIIIGSVFVILFPATFSLPGALSACAWGVWGWLE